MFFSNIEITDPKDDLKGHFHGFAHAQGRMTVIVSKPIETKEIHLDRPSKFKIQISQTMANSTHLLKC